MMRKIGFTLFFKVCNFGKEARSLGLVPLSILWMALLECHNFG